MYIYIYIHTELLILPGRQTCSICCLTLKLVTQEICRHRTSLQVHHSCRERKERKQWGREKAKGRKKSRNVCIKFVAFDKGCQCCEGDSGESQGFVSQWITKLRSQGKCSATARIGSPSATGVPPGETWGKGNKFHMLERGNFHRMVLLLLTPAERCLCTFPCSCRRLKVTTEATEDGFRCSRGVGDLYGLKSVVWIFKD